MSAGASAAGVAGMHVAMNGGAPASGAPDSGVAGSIGSAPAADDGKPTWAGVYTYTFKMCRIDICHGGGRAGLNMATAEAAYQSLVRQPASAAGKCASLGKQRVVPGDPDNSLLYLKLDINAPCGDQMPPGGSLSDEARARVAAWIASGAHMD